MKKLSKFFIFFVFAFFSFYIGKVNAKQVNIYMFYGDGCPHCAAAEKYLDTIKNDYDIKVYKYEIWNNKENVKVLNKISSYLKTNASGIPYVIIDNTAIIGYTPEVTDDTYKYHIKVASKEDFNDYTGYKLGIVDKGSITKKQNKNKNDISMKMNLPIIGKVDLKTMSLPIVSIILGLVDGFNPCAMWILLFLISTLIGMKDKKRLWILGLTFLITSAGVYLLFMLSLLSFAKMISGISFVRRIIACVALIGGILNLKSYIESLSKDDGCNVVKEKKRKKIFLKIKKFTHEKSFIIALLGIMALAASVNIIELACSAGIPVIFTQLLAMNNLNGFQYGLYIFLYILFFMADDLLIFAVAVKTFELTGISNKYSKYSHLIGGLLMVLIGVLLIVKPEWLMFNF